MGENKEVVQWDESGRHLAVRPPAQLLIPIAAPAELARALEAARDLVANTLEDGRDYGTIPGTKRPTLYKAGAEHVTGAYGCYPRFRIVESEVDHDRVVPWTKTYKSGPPKIGSSMGLYRYVVECEIVSRTTGDVVGSFYGSASTMESKYVDRPRDSENTILKMAEKRALVGAVLVTFGLSDQFTQDLEDLPRGAAQGAEEETLDAEPVGRDSEITWGAKKGTKLRDLELSYVKWAAEPDRTFPDEWKAAFRKELAARELEAEEKRQADTGGMADPQESTIPEPTAPASGPAPVPEASAQPGEDDDPEDDLSPLGF